MTISEIVSYLETLAPPALQESYDNAGLITGSPDWACSGIICSLDTTEKVVDDAMAKGCNLIVAHHPIIFKGLKKITGKNYVERTIIKAIQNNIAIYAIHTNLDSVINGVNGMMADKLGLQHQEILVPKSGQLKKLYCYVPVTHLANVKEAVFAAGAGQIGNYSECSFAVNGVGTFKPNDGANPFSGEVGQCHEDEEQKLEVLFPAWLEAAVLKAMWQNHPYEEVAYEVITLDNVHQLTGLGIVGELPEAVTESDFLGILKETFGLSVVRHTALLGKKVKKVSLCGGAGSSFISHAIASKSDVYVTADVKYHEFFDADGRILLADIGHFESEQFTIDLLYAQLLQKFPNFAVLKTAINTNPVFYF
ncbi:MAG: Nif3-like dinuclear metal center hexameric protein [Niabella sp.]